MERSVFHAHSNATDTHTILHDEIHGKVLDKEKTIKLQGHPIQSVEDRVPSPVRSSGASVGLTALSKLKALTSKCALIDLAFISPREGEAK
jgi:hypothetical protein